VPFLQGPFGIELTYTEYPGGLAQGMARLDLTNATVDLGRASWRKGPGVPGRVYAEFIIENGRLSRVPIFDIAAGSLLAAHDRDPRVWPHPQEAPAIGAAAHRVIAGAKTAADDDGEFWHHAPPTVLSQHLVASPTATTLFVFINNKDKIPTAKTKLTKMKFFLFNLI